MRIALFAAFAAIFSAAGAAPHASFDHAKAVACAKPKLTGKNFSVTCTAPNNPLGLSFVLGGQKTDTDAALTKLSVIKAGAKPQDFKLEGQMFYDGIDTALELMDVNFDGFADIKLATSTSAGPNMGYDYWLYVPKTGAFRATKLGEQLSGFDIFLDPKTKTIAVNGRSSCCSWNKTTYAWRGGALQAIESSDTMSFSPSLPAFDMTSTLCGSQTKHFNEAGLVTRIDFELDSVKDFTPEKESICDKPQLTAQGKLLDKLTANPKGYRINAKDNYHFTVTFDKPRKDSE